MSIAMPSLQNKAEAQWTALKSIPGAVTNYWPAFFTFAIVDYLKAIVLNAVPEAGGVSGTVLNAGVNGATKVISFVTWDAIKAGSVQ